MDLSPIPGFVTRKQAAEQCKRSERTLQRYWSRAVELHDADILSHLKLHTEDGDIVDGINVTKDLIEDLKKKGQNPTWYADTTWVVATYRPRPEMEAPPKSPSVPVEDKAPEEETARPVTNEVVELLKDQLSKRDDDIKHLREELSAKNELLRAKNELEQERNELEKERHGREKETNELMKNLGGLLATLQQGLLADKTGTGSSAASVDEPASQERSKARDAEIITQPHEPAAEDAPAVHADEVPTSVPTSPTPKSKRHPTRKKKREARPSRTRGSRSKPSKRSTAQKLSSKAKPRATSASKEMKASSIAPRRKTPTTKPTKKKASRKPAAKPGAKSQSHLRDRLSHFLRGKLW